MQKKVKGEKAATQTFCFAGENKKILDAVKKVAEREERDYSYVLCKILKDSPIIQSEM